MIKTIQNEYRPDAVSPPGETLADALAERGMTQAELAKRMGRPKPAVNEIVRGRKAVTAETALELEKVLNVPASFWLRREQDYREFLARRKKAAQLLGETDIVRRFPVKELAALGWIEPSGDRLAQLQALLSFFGVAGPEELESLCLHTQAKFRQSRTVQPDTWALNAWLRHGELCGQQVETAPYSEKRFREVLSQARALTLHPDPACLENLKALCASAGVALVVAKELPKVRTSGATRWLKADKALIQMSLRFSWSDAFWFSFFHEAGHILLHGKEAAFLEDHAKTTKERDADNFAQDWLIPAVDWKAFTSRARPSRPAIERFAKAVGVGPGIVVGRLQHEKIIPRNRFNALRPRWKWNGSR